MFMFSQNAEETWSNNLSNFISCVLLTSLIIVYLKFFKDKKSLTDDQKSITAESGVSEKLENWLTLEKERREKIELRKRQLREHVLDLQILQLYKNDGILSRYILAAVADIFEREVLDKSDRLELTGVLNRTVVIDCYRRVLDSLHTDMKSNEDYWCLYCEMCRSIRIPCCESEDFARKVYKAGIITKIVKILSGKNLKTTYQENKVWLDLVGIGLLTCAVCCSAVLTPTPRREIEKMKRVAQYYESSSVENVKSAATMLSRVVQCVPVQKEITSYRYDDVDKDTGVPQNDLSSKKHQAANGEKTHVATAIANEQRHQVTGRRRTPKSPKRTRTYSFLSKFNPKHNS